MLTPSAFSGFSRPTTTMNARMKMHGGHVDSEPRHDDRPERDAPDQRHVA